VHVNTIHVLPWIRTYLNLVVAVGQPSRRIQLRGRALHFVRHQGPEVTLDLRNSVHELVRLLCGLQVTEIVLAHELAHVRLELLGVVVVLDALLAGLADRAGALVAGVLVWVT